MVYNWVWYGVPYDMVWKYKVRRYFCECVVLCSRQERYVTGTVFHYCNCYSPKGVFQKTTLVTWNASLSRARVDILLKILSKGMGRNIEGGRGHKEKQVQRSTEWFDAVVPLRPFVWSKKVCSSLLSRYQTSLSWRLNDWRHQNITLQSTHLVWLKYPLSNSLILQVRVKVHMTALLLTRELSGPKRCNCWQREGLQKVEMIFFFLNPISKMAIPFSPWQGK